jgi:hypothetical protein
MEQRGVTEEDVLQVINNPASEETIYDPIRKKWKSYSRIINHYSNVEKYLIVVHSKYNSDINIITVIWTDRGGLRFHGFS